DWKQEGEGGQILLPYSKITVEATKYRKMQSDLDPIFWMKFYADKNTSWKGQPESDPLFVLGDGKPLTKSIFVGWLREMGGKAGHARSHRLSGISFRRGGGADFAEFRIWIQHPGKIG